MSISLTNVMQWNGSAVAIIFAIATIIEVLVVGAHTTTLFGVLMMAGLATAIIGWLLERRQRSVGSTAITTEAETLKA